jgi:hypothetical protein
MLGDKARDSAELRDDLDQRGTKPVIGASSPAHFCSPKFGQKARRL